VKPVLSIVVPAYNEARRLPSSLQQILAFLNAQSFDAEVIVVDDGSDDRTAEAAEAIDAGRVTLTVIRNDHRGKGFAVRTGMLAAQGRYVLFTDADLAVPMDEWRKMQPLFEQGYDVVIGSREGLGAQRIGEPWYRHLMGRVFNTVVRTIALGGIQDTQCGFKAFTYEAAQRLFGAVQLYGANAAVVKGAAVTGFDVEVLFLARKWGFKLYELPVTWQYGEASKVNPLRDTIRMFSDVLRVRWNDLRGLYAAPTPLPKMDDRR
jgi:dolichyl-phosphate beta-glucosyltransferase